MQSHIITHVPRAVRWLLPYGYSLHVASHWTLLTYVASQRRTYILRPVFCHGKYLHYINLHVYVGVLFRLVRCGPLWTVHTTKGVLFCAGHGHLRWRTSILQPQKCSQHLFSLALSRSWECVCPTYLQRMYVFRLLGLQVCNHTLSHMFQEQLSMR